MLAVQTVESARDRNEGSIDRPEVGDALARRRLDADALQLAPHALFLPPPSDAAHPIAHIAPLEREVVHDGKIRDESEVLVDEAEARRSSLLGEPVGVQLLAVNRDERRRRAGDSRLAPG